LIVIQSSCHKFLHFDFNLFIGTLKCCYLKFYLGYVLVVIAEKFRFSAEFIEMRRQALDVFVNRIASHRELRQSEDLRLFLQAEEEVMAHLQSLFLCGTVSILDAVCFVSLSTLFSTASIIVLLLLCILVQSWIIRYCYWFCKYLATIVHTVQVLLILFLFYNILFSCIYLVFLSAQFLFFFPYSLFF